MSTGAHLRTSKRVKNQNNKTIKERKKKNKQKWNSLKLQSHILISIEATILTIFEQSAQTRTHLTTQYTIDNIFRTKTKKNLK